MVVASEGPYTLLKFVKLGLGSSSSSSNGCTSSTSSQEESSLCTIPILVVSPVGEEVVLTSPGHIARRSMLHFESKDEGIPPQGSVSQGE